jgi:hypothetical protein
MCNCYIIPENPAFSAMMRGVLHVLVQVFRRYFNLFGHDCVLPGKLLVSEVIGAQHNLLVASIEAISAWGWSGAGGAEVWMLALARRQESSEVHETPVDVVSGASRHPRGRGES